MGDRVQFRCRNDTTPGTWYEGQVQAFFDAGDMSPLKVGTDLAQSIDLDTVFSRPRAQGGCPSRWLRIQVATGLWAEGYYQVLVLRGVSPSPQTDDIRRTKEPHET